MKIRLAYGRDGMWIDLPENADITVIEPKLVPGLPDEAAAIRQALRAPIGSPALRDLVGPDDTVAVVFSDLTRPMPNGRVQPVVLAELEEAGVAREKITLINGLGTHRQQTDAELRGMLGDAIVDNYRVVQHNAWAEDMVQVGVNHNGRPIRINRTYMDASKRVVTGFIEPHFFAGFSGGPKGVLPGIADVDTVLDNHDAGMIADPHAVWATIDGNPIWAEMVKGALATDPTFLLNVTLNRNKEITGVFAGELVQAHRAGCDFVKRTAMRPVEDYFDIVITTNSGYPLDLNLYQAVKGMSAAAQVVREGGNIIAVAECWDGIPAHGQYGRLLRESESPRHLLDRVMSPGFREHDQWQVQLQAQIQLRANVSVYAGKLTDEEIRQSLFEPCHSVEDEVASLLAQNPKARIAILPEGPQTVPYVAA